MIRSHAMTTAALAALLIVAAPVAASAAPGSAQPSQRETPTAGESTTGRAYPGDPEAEARLVAAEERRLIDIKSTLGSAVATDVVLSRPFRLTTTGVPTIVLVGRGSPYTLTELAQIAPQSVQLQPDGSYLVTEHLYVAAGATLKLAAREGMTVRLRSTPEGFATIVTDGGTLEFEGSSEFPVVIESWNGETVDDVTDDGRAYVRVHAGRGEFVNAEFGSLGFWSGVTGGLSLTGAVVPDPLDPVDGEDMSASDEIEEEIPGAEALAEVESLETLALGDDLEGDAYTSALVQSVLVQRSAFGVFVTNADRVEIRDSHFDDNLVDGVVFHRDVSNSLVIGTSATGNGQDGFNLARATSSVVFDRLSAVSNGRNGITIEGRPLVDGPSATGIPVTVYG
ncbi:MAG TPA: right-handed parallel beta-helix repeat-containing protein, partial [Rhodoglobus sp.]|nr:right-handed parallel beta-helix repeat-containing protein [Rhodoglobus sp.]